jgi:hypothetical protein
VSPVFIPGVELAGRLYWEAVRPLLLRHFPTVSHSAALVGPGSEVLGFDTERSTDHDWGPRLQLFLRTDDVEHGPAISDMLGAELPATIAGYATDMRRTRHEQRGHHGVEVAELGAWLTGYLGFDPRQHVTTTDWLATPTQVLAEVTGGAVFHDGLGELTDARQRLAWYPDDVWRYVLACQWQRISQEEPFVGRCREVGDDLGAAVVAGRLVRELMRLCLLLHRVYPPYSKWLGSAFGRLPCGLTAVFTAALSSDDQLVAACEAVGGLCNDITGGDVDASARFFHDRPFRVLHAERFAGALVATIRDPVLRGLPLVGAVDQFVDSTDVLGRRCLTRALMEQATLPLSEPQKGG